MQKIEKFKQYIEQTMPHLTNEEVSNLYKKILGYLGTEHVEVLHNHMATLPGGLALLYDALTNFLNDEYLSISYDGFEKIILGCPVSDVRPLPSALLKACVNKIIMFSKFNNNTVNVVKYLASKGLSAHFEELFGAATQDSSNLYGMTGLCIRFIANEQLEPITKKFHRLYKLLVGEVPVVPLVSPTKDALDEYINSSDHNKLLALYEESSGHHHDAKRTCEASDEGLPVAKRPCTAAPADESTDMDTESDGAGGKHPEDDMDTTGADAGLFEGS
ncbi:MAG UNVERIFIED_CONTAM: hypothetical protein LVQ98_04415 [Rickettsiaceae bacterium]